MHMNDFKISWVAWLGSLTKPSKVEQPASDGHLSTTVTSLLHGQFFWAPDKTAINFLVKKKP